MNRELKAIKIHNEDGLDAAASLMQDYVDQAMQIDTQFCPRDFAELLPKHYRMGGNACEIRIFECLV